MIIGKVFWSPMVVEATKSGFHITACKFSVPFTIPGVSVCSPVVKVCKIPAMYLLLGFTIFIQNALLVVRCVLVIPRERLDRPITRKTKFTCSHFPPRFRVRCCMMWNSVCKIRSAGCSAAVACQSSPKVIGGKRVTNSSGKSRTKFVSSFQLAIRWMQVYAIDK